MGFQEKLNTRSNWYRKRHPNVSESRISTPIDNSLSQPQVKTRLSSGEPMVIQITLKSVWGFLCQRLIRLFQKHPQNLAQTS